VGLAPFDGAFSGFVFIKHKLVRRMDAALLIIGTRRAVDEHQHEYKI